MASFEKTAVFAAGALFGVGLAVAFKTGKAQKACVKVLAKGMELKECAAELIEEAKEAAEDIVAEAEQVKKIEA
jgi:hypothetical protein